MYHVHESNVEEHSPSQRKNVGAGFNLPQQDPHRHSNVAGARGEKVVR